MKDWIQRNYLRNERNTNTIRRLVQETKDAIPNKRVRQPIETIPQRMQDGIDAEGIFKW